MKVEKLGDPRDIWVQCPHCERLFYIEGMFYQPRYDHLELYCPGCRQYFDKKDSLRTWGR